MQSGLFKRELTLTRLIYGFALCVAVGLFVFAVRADRVSTQRAETAARANVQNELSEFRSRLEGNLHNNIQLVRGIPGLFTLHPDLSQEEFARALAPLFNGQSQVRNIAAAPNMVITLMYPIEGNEEAIGLDYRKKPDQFEAADRARRLRKLVLAGPVNLVQGGTGFISRIPIFETDADGNERFWGIVSAVIDADKLYEDSGLLRPDLPIDIAIRGKDGTGRSGENFFGNPDVFAADPVHAEIQLPQGTWVLAATPKRGWAAPAPELWPQRGFFLLAAAMTVVPLFMLARTRDQLLKVAVRRQRAEYERRRIEQQMLRAQKLESLGIMAGGIAHDFNNILTAIMGYTQLVSDSPSIDAQSAGFLTHVDSAAERAAALCNQLLAYSGKGQFVVEPVDLSCLIRETESLLRVSVPKMTEVQLILRDDIPSIEADASQIRQIVMNLITNGIDAIGEDSGLLTLETGVTAITREAIRKNLAGNECVPGEYVFVKVTDSGCGMDETTLKKVFDPFYTTKSTGRGLGMAAVLGVVRSHNGTIFCETSPGHGATFTVAFPASERSSEPPSETSVHVEPSAPMTVLVVDDEPAVRSMISKALSRFGHTIMMAGDGQEGLRLFTESVDEISLCIVDMAMPIMGGLETLHAMRNIRPGLCVVMMSGFSEEDVGTNADDEQPDAFLKKPFRVDELIQIIGRVSPQALMTAGG